MSETTHEDALRHAAALVSDALKETEARCRVLGQYINDCERNDARTASWHDAVRELSALHGRRTGLKRRHDLIQQALDCQVSGRPANASLPAPPDRGARRTQQQIQIQVRARRRS